MSKKNWTGKREPRKPKRKKAEIPADNSAIAVQKRKPASGHAA